MRSPTASGWCLAPCLGSCFVVITKEEAVDGCSLCSECVWGVLDKLEE